MSSRITRQVATLLLGMLAAPLCAAADDTGLWRPPVSGGRATWEQWAGLQLFAAGSGFAFGRRSMGFGLQGGAALALDRNVDLTASYRLSGFSVGEVIGTDFSDVETRLDVLLFGIAIEF